MTRHLIVLFVLTAATISANAALAQGAPSPEQRDACAKEYASLREDAEAKGNLIKTAGAQNAPPEETCKIAGSYRLAVVKIVKYVQANAAQCGIPPSVMEQLKAIFISAESLYSNACRAAEQAGKSGPPRQINDFGDPTLERQRF
jgi:hypothetical protein